jgi:hypothetical protein
MKKMSGMAAVLAVCMALLSHSVVVGVPLSEGMQSPEQPLTRLAFGSCSKHDRPQPLWSPIADFQPQLWIWLGTVTPHLKSLHLHLLHHSSDLFFIIIIYLSIYCCLK